MLASAGDGPEEGLRGSFRGLALKSRKSATSKSSRARGVAESLSRLEDRVGFLGKTTVSSGTLNVSFNNPSSENVFLTLGE